MKLFRTKRLLVVLGITAIVAIVIGGIVAMRLKVIRHNYLVARDKGFTEYQRGDNVGAMRDLGTYLSGYPLDATALGAYANSRLQVEEPDGSNIFGAISAYRRLVDLQPDSEDIQRRLVGLYAQANLNIECVLLADKLLKRDPKDPSLLHDRAAALFRLSKFKDALAGINAYLAEKPDDLEARVLRLEILSRMGPPTPDLVQDAANIRTADPKKVKWKPGDVRWKLLQSVACGMAGDIAGSRKWAEESTKTAAPDAPFARIRILQLWQTKQAALGDAALEDAAKQFADDSSIRLLQTHRLYQLGRYEELLKQVSVKGDTASARATLIGYQCLAWMALKEPQKAKAEALRAELAGKSESFYAHDWATVLAYAWDSSASKSDSRTKAVEDIAARHPHEAYFQMVVAGMESKDIRTAMRALRMWEAVANQEPAWSEPVTRMAETLLALGHATEAAKVAHEALLRSPDDRGALVVLALAAVPPGQSLATFEPPPSLLTLLDAIHAKYPDDERTMGLRVLVEAKVAGAAAGVAVLKETLGRQPAPSLDTMFELAAASRIAKLGQEAACYSTVEKVYGMVPRLAIAKAMALAQDGRVADGLKLLEDSRSKSTTQRQAWDIAYAQYLEVNHEPKAHDNWIALSDAYPTDAPVQWLVLGIPSIRADHEVAGRVIERLRPLIGADDFSYKLARAQWLLSTGKSGGGAVTEATALLSDMTKVSADAMDPRSLLSAHLLLVECLEQNQNFSGAIEQLEIAAALAPNSAPIALELARLLQNQGNLERSGLFLNKLAGRTDLNDIERQQCAMLLQRQGEPNREIALLEGGLTTRGDKQSLKLMLAALYAQRGQAAKAGALFDELMKEPDLAIVRLSAPFYASHQRLSDAREAIGQLQKMKLEPAVLATEEGDFAARFGKPEEAIAAYQSALKAAPSDAPIWYRLIGFYLQTGQGKEALAAVAQAQSKVSGDRILGILQGKSRYIEKLSGDVRYRPILLSLITAPQFANAAEAVLARILAPVNIKLDDSGSPDRQLAIDISGLADRYPQYAALQNLAVDLDVSQRRLEEAAAIATRAMQTFPASVEPARLATAAFAEAGQWSETLGASNQWRLRAPGDTMAPDVMIGVSYLGMGRPDETLEHIKPYMDQAASDPEHFESVIVLYAQSEIAKGRSDNAEAKLWPLAKGSQHWLSVFIQIAGRNAPPEVADRWLNMAREELKGDLDLELVYVTAASELSHRSSDPKLMATALEDLQKAVAASKDEPAKLSMGYFVLGMLQESQKAPDSGEASYRRAVELNPKLAQASNNLAMVLARRGALEEALTYGKQAVKLAPNVAEFQDTLAFVQDKAGDLEGAIEHWVRAMKLQPDNLQWRVNLAQTYIDVGQKAQDPLRKEYYGKARSMLLNSDGTPYRPAKIDPELKDRLSLLQEKLGIHL